LLERQHRSMILRRKCFYLLYCHAALAGASARRTIWTAHLEKQRATY
jgi:hypothetical protein